MPNVKLPLIQHVGFFGDAIGNTNLLTWIALLLVPVLTVFLFRTRWGLRLRAVGEKPRAADTVGLPVIPIRYVAVIASGCSPRSAARTCRSASSARSTRT